MSGNEVRILVVDDDEISRWSLARLLTRDGYECHEAQDGRQALERLALTEYDVVITDLRMPLMGGLELVRAAGDRYSGRIIMVTGYGSTEDWLSAMGYGVFEFINKPIDYTNLLQIIRSMTGAHQPPPTP